MVHDSNRVVNSSIPVCALRERLYLNDTPSESIRDTQKVSLNREP